MTWQDILISICSLILAIALVPALLGRDKPPIATSIVTGITLLVLAYTFLTLNLYFSFFMNGITASLWLVLAYQKSMQKRDEKN